MTWTGVHVGTQRSGKVLESSIVQRLKQLLMSLANFGTKFPFKLGMMWYPRKIHSQPDLTPHHFWIAYQISG
ncbi:hypothetical protein Hanom_Chr12g01120101 [Helianthus anomalus]